MLTPPPPFDSTTTWARALGVSDAAVALWSASAPFDLHNDLYVPARLVGYDVHRWHRPRLPFGAFFGHSDLPRLRAARMGAVTLDVATNPARRAARRAAVTLRNLERIQADLARHPADLALVSTASQARAAQAEGKLACFLGIQGGQAFQHDREALDRIPDIIHRITLVHLTNSGIGSTSSPLGPDRGGLTARGLELLEVMDARRILIDLAHINHAGFMHAVEVHARLPGRWPLVVTHTGVSAVQPHWRNVDDVQLRAVAATGGVVGIMLHTGFLAGRTLPRCGPEVVVRHLEHVLNVCGEAAGALGTDYDGMVVPPLGLTEVTALPRLVQAMLDRDWPEARVMAVLGGNAMRLVEAIRP